MKKLLAVLLAVAMIFAFAACTNEPAEPDTSATDAQEEIPVDGMLINANCTEEEFVEYLAKKDANRGVIFYNDLNTMLLALQAGEISSIVSIPEAVADYIIARNPGITKNVSSFGAVVSYQMAVKQENTDLLDSLNEAIGTLYDNGTMEQLVADYIDAYTTGTEDPEAVEIPVIEGADTIKVAVTGDVPPMDLVTADGKAAGFNVALLAEMSKLMNVNFELVPMNTAARALSIASDKVDAIFWIIENSDNPGIDLPDTLAATRPYYSGARCVLKLAE